MNPVFIVVKRTKDAAPPWRSKKFERKIPENYLATSPNPSVDMGYFVVKRTCDDLIYRCIQ
jgi:hypothetical protein